MKKSPTKLALRKETLRTLAAVDLRRAVGGYDPEANPILEQTEDKNCPARAIVTPGG